MRFQVRAVNNPEEVLVEFGVGVFVGEFDYPELAKTGRAFATPIRVHAPTFVAEFLC